MAETGTQNTQPAQPKPDPKNLTLTQGPISETSTGFMVKIKAELTQGSSKRIDGVLSIMEGVDKINSLQTINGVCFYPITEHFSSAGKSRTLIFSLDGAEKVERDITINFPSKATKERNKKDPDELQVSRYRNLAGINTLFLRVVDVAGNGIKKTVQIYSQGVADDVNLDQHGTATWTYPYQLTPRETINADICVSGIHEKAKIALRGPRPVNYNRAAAWTWGWWYGVNNGRGTALLIATVLVWIFGLTIGFGDPIVFFDHTQLSPQEIYYNQGTENYKVQADPQPSVWHSFSNAVGKTTWLFLIPLFTTFAPFYFFFSLREEIAEGMIEGLEALVDRPYVKAEDPLAERVMSWAGIRSVARRAQAQTQPVITTPGPQIEGVQQPPTQAGPRPIHVPFLDMFKSDILSDLLVEVFPKMLRHFFR